MIKYKFDKEIDDIRKQQHLQHKLLSKDVNSCLGDLNTLGSCSIANSNFINEQNSSISDGSLSDKINLSIVLQNKVRLKGKLIKLTTSNKYKYRIIMKDNSKHCFILDLDLVLNSGDFQILLKEHLNSLLEQLLHEAKQDFPKWFFNSTKPINKIDVLFSVNDIEEQYKLQKARFGTWRFAAMVGLFTSMKPHVAEFNQIVKLEIIK